MTGGKRMAWTHYFIFKKDSSYYGHWVEVQSPSERKAIELMIETYGTAWDEYHFSTYSATYIQKSFPKGLLARHEID